MVELCRSPPIFGYTQVSLSFLPHDETVGGVASGESLTSQLRQHAPVVADLRRMTFYTPQPNYDTSIGRPFGPGLLNGVGHQTAEVLRMPVTTIVRNSEPGQAGYFQVEGDLVLTARLFFADQ